MITLVKLGGSLITDKTQRSTFRADVMTRLADEIRVALDKTPDLRLVIGHGSGSFGHFEAKQYDTINGVKTSEQWRGFASVAVVAAELNYLVTKTLHTAEIPVFRVPPSASARAQDGVITHMELNTLIQAMDYHLVPLVYGDVAFDSVRGGTIISTETVFTYLVRHLPIERILLLGEVDGVYDAQKQVIEHITPNNFASIRASLGGSSGVDVTGGMITKVQDMLKLATHPPYPMVQIINGKTKNLLRDTLLGATQQGTRITK